MKTKFIHVGKRTLSVVLSIMMIVSMMIVGMVTTNAVTNVTIYFTPNSDWLNSGYDIKANIKYGGNDSEWLLSDAATDTGKTIDSNKVYSVSFSLEHDGLYILKLEARDSSNTWKAETILRNDTSNWYTADNFNGKYWNGSSWVDPSWDSGGSTSGSTSVAPAGVLSGNDVMFYVKSWNNTLYLKNQEGTSKNVTNVKDGYGYIQISRNDADTYHYISNSSSWGGNSNEKIKSAKGGELFDGQNSNNNYTPATTGTTTFADSKTEFTQGTDISTTLTTTFSNGTTSSYSKELPLYVQYYVDDTLVNSDQLAATASTTYTLDLNSYSVGSHTLKTVLTDGNIYYLSGEAITFNISDGGTTTSYKITASAYDSTKGTVTVDGSTLAPSVQTTTSNSSINIAVTPTTGNVIQSLSIGGYAIPLNETEKTSGYTNSSYSISADTEIEVVFTSTSQPVVSGYYYQKYVTDTYMVPSGDKVELTKDSTGTFAYTKITTSGDNFFLISTDSNTYYFDGNIYKNNIADPNLSSKDFITIDNYNANIDASTNKPFAKTYYTGDLYLIVYYPSTTVNTTNSPIVVATTTLPGSSGPSDPSDPSDPDTYKVTMNQGIKSRRDSKYLGTSYLDGDSANKEYVDKDINDLTVTLTTETVNVANLTYADLSLGYTGYMYQVYGYSIKMTLSDDTTRVASVVNNLIDTNSAKPIAALANGVYTCEYTFPSNIKSATVTPIFSVSADYAKAKGISYTAVYLKMKPGSNLFSNTYEPNYYTWRAERTHTDKDDGLPMLIQKGDKVLEREPEGAYGGQKMLYIGNNMYVAYVQSDLYGILFDDYPHTSVQTFDYNEFIKLQKLGYNNITFEPKGDGSVETVASGLNTTHASKGTKVYIDSEQTEITISDDALNNEFELDVDIEGYYIDVFGNRLQDESGNDIKRSDLLADSSAATVKDELAALLKKTGKSNELFGARYGAQDRKNTANDYGMQYAIYNYYVDGTTKKLISQQISGYGTIEGAIGPNSSSMTNAEYMASLSTPTSSTDMTYRVGTAETNSLEKFATGYELISKDYIGVPYLVSYKLKVTDGSTSRIDGKWYYMNTTPQVTVNVKTSLLNNGALNMADGKIVENTTPGTATVNYKSFDTIDQGTSAVMRATPNEGFAFVGFYEENGDFISKYNPYGNKVFAVDTTVYAVFKEVGNGSITITNNIYDSAKPNPTPGGGNGKVSVTLVITPWNKTYDEQGNPVYGTPVTYTGETSVSATIEDGDLFRIILTGERYGADNFLAFRMPDKDINGNIYYVALDDAEFLNVTKDTNGKAVSATYETADMVWDWTEQLGTGGTSNTLQAKTFNYYTDFSKTDINATLEYKYKDRFGNWKTYIVKNVPMDVSQINEGNYVPADSLVLQYAPPIDEVFNSCSWTVANIDARNSYALLKADQTYKTFNTYVDRNADGIYSLEEKSNERIVAQFNESIQIEAPETKGSATFKYWKRYLLDSTGAKSGSGEIFSNMRSISIKVTFDSAFEPVYDAVSDTYFTNVQDAKYTREKSTSTDDKGFVYDYVYADFLLQFDTLEGNDTFKNIVANNGNIKFGVILEMDYNYLYDGKTIKTPKTEENLLKQTITQLNTGLADGGHKSGWNATTDSKLDQYNYYYNLYDLTDKASNLSNFGRYDYFFKFDNTEANRARVYNVYSYIIYTDSDGNKQIVVSNPKTLSIYATGIKNDGETAQA